MQRISLYSLVFTSLFYVIGAVMALQFIWGLNLSGEFDLSLLLDLGGQVLFIFLVLTCAYMAWKYYFQEKYNQSIILSMAPLGIYVFTLLLSYFFLS